METKLETPAAGRAAPGLYLTFSLGEESYGLEILKVQEIIGVMPVTRIPRAPDFVRGVINLRGKVIPVIDLRLKFGLEPRENTSKTCIIVVQIQEDAGARTIGVLVDYVKEVIDIGGPQIEATPQLSDGTEVTYLQALAKVGSGVIMLLDLERILEAEVVVDGSQACIAAAQA